MQEMKNDEKGFCRKNAMLLMLLFTTAIICVFEILWLAKKGNTPQVYTDIVLEEMGAEFANKSIELFLYWFGIFFGLFLISFGVWLCKKRRLHITGDEIKLPDGKLAALLVAVILTGNYAFYGYLNPTIVLAEIAIFISLLSGKDTILELTTLYFVSVYSLSGLYRLYVFIGGNHLLNLHLISLVSLTGVIIAAVFLSKKIIRRTILLFQIPIPFLLLIYFLNKYRYHGQDVFISPEKSVYVFVWIVIFIAFAISIFNAKKKWNAKSSLEIISIGIPIVILAFNRFSGQGFVMLNDMHHPAENTIAFNEIVNLGLKPFSQYVPVSGLYSFVQGFFLETFGKGNYTAYSISNNVYYLTIIVLLVIGLRLHLNSFLTFISSIFIFVSDYSRVALILPFMLILLSRKLISKPNFWLMLWILFSLGYGLYYPAYGVAVGVSLLPLGFYQIKRCVAEAKNSCKQTKILYAALWTTIAVIVVLSIPLLIGTLKHVLDVGDGLLYVDGVTIFGQALPSNFLPFLKTNGFFYTIRLVLGYAVRFTTPMIVVWLSFCAVLNVFAKDRKKSFKEFVFSLNFDELSILTCLIFPLICFYFSLYRMGAHNLFNRAVYIIDYSLILLIIIFYKCGKDNFNKYMIIAIAIFVCTFGNVIGINGLTGKYFNRYEVADNYVYTGSRPDAPRLGKGFVREDFMNGINAAATKFNSMNKERNYYALFSNGLHGMGYDAILNIRGTAMLEIMMIRGYSLSRDTAQKLARENTIVGNAISPADHYYLYKWLCTSGKYIWSEKDQVFYPMQQTMGGGGIADIRKANSRIAVSMPSIDIGRYAASLGNSVATLQNVLSEKKDIHFDISHSGNVVQLNFAEEIDGNEIDYVFMDFDIGENRAPFIMGEEHKANNKIEKKLMKHEYNKGMYAVLEWLDDEHNVHTMRAAIENGKLLMPIGAGVRWLNNNHSNIKAKVVQAGNIIETPTLKSVKFYRLRDLEVSKLKTKGIFKNSHF